MNRPEMNSFFFRAISLYLIFAAGNALFLNYSPRLFPHGGPEPSGFVWMFALLGFIAFFFGLPGNVLLAMVRPAESEPLGDGWPAVLFVVLAPILNALLYAWLIPCLFWLAKLLWRGIMHLPKEPD